MANTLEDLIAHHPESAPAIGAPGRGWLTYGGLRQLSRDVRKQLRGAGIGAQDRVAIVLPNGPEMASAFFAVAQSATTAPLNPAYREDEFSFYLEDLGAKVLLLDDGYDGPAYAAAMSLGLKVLRAKVNDEAPAGQFVIDGGDAGEAGESLTSDDVALILHTSGTTSRPKIVPLLQSNIAASAQNIMAALDLTPQDRCLNVMPLFHIHGLIAATSASFAAGASIWCAPGFDALKFFGWMSEARPTWYTAVPTMHQAILSRSGRNAEVIADVPLRFLRSSSASLPPQVFVSLAETFDAPVIEAYGMTEATHQMTSNPLPPLQQKPGSVGIEAGPLVRTADPVANKLVDGLGEVVISGSNVTPGYESNPEANEKNFFEFEG
ncbi:MAG: AMP-binding protein, partial [Boseongicola sp.]|nr:AMP-binding protein [Boseongicola sp.]